MTELKICTKCGLLKPLSEFYKNKRGKNGLSSTCKGCNAEYAKTCNAKHKEKRNAQSREWRLNNLERSKATEKQWKEANPERVKENRKKYYENNKESQKEYSRQWGKENPQKKKEMFRVWYLKNREENIQRAREWQEQNPEKNRLSKRADWNRRYANPKNRLSFCVSGAVRRSLNGKTKNGVHWELLVGYNISELREHLEKQFQNGMTWDNYGSVWHLDHIIPVAVFNFETPEDIDFRRCWALKNLQPLWASENMSKGAKITAQFQPALAMGI